MLINKSFYIRIFVLTILFCLFSTCGKHKESNPVNTEDSEIIEVTDNVDQAGGQVEVVNPVGDHIWRRFLCESLSRIGSSGRTSQGLRAVL